jgi:hypothetical protein
MRLGSDMGILQHGRLRVGIHGQSDRTTKCGCFVAFDGELISYDACRDGKLAVASLIVKVHQSLSGKLPIMDQCVFGQPVPVALQSFGRRPASPVAPLPREIIVDGKIA